MTVQEARAAGKYLAKNDTYATLIAAATFAGPGRDGLRLAIDDRELALSIGQFVLAAKNRATLMRALADELDSTATLARVALMGRGDYEAVIREADAPAIEACVCAAKIRH
jgi:hypothetical protein